MTPPIDAHKIRDNFELDELEVDRIVLVRFLVERKVLHPEGLQLLLFVLNGLRVRFGDQEETCSNGDIAVIKDVNKNLWKGSQNTHPRAVIFPVKSKVEKLKYFKLLR
jgi:hypothetical protein